ncbi:MAG: alpha/beta hydrolase [Solirubrobacterales bacterium]
MGAPRAIRVAWLALAATVALVAGLLVVPDADAREKLSTVKGADGPGPAQYDKVTVNKIGPKKAGNVLVLIPGTIGGAGDFTLIARDLVARTPGLQVWAIDRRSQAFEDTSMFERALAGEATPQEAFDYYLGWLLNPAITERFQPLDESTVPFARKWGMKVALRDVRKVVRKAGARGRNVVLGGHSLGASLAAAYTAWDFKGKPGYKGLDGLVLIDGGLLGSFDRLTLAEAKAALAELEAGSPFTDLLGIGLPWSAGIFAELGALYAKADPKGRSSLQDSPLLPPAFKPPVDVTNRALLGYAFDKTTSPEGLALIQVRAGRLQDSGDPRDWKDGEVTPLRRLRNLFAQEPVNAVEWYFPQRLSIDSSGANAMRRNEVTDYLGLRLFHSRKVDVPLYAIQTDLTDGGVLRGARAFIKRTKTGPKEATLIDSSGNKSHLDPLTASRKKNDLVKTLPGFLDAHLPD